MESDLIDNSDAQMLGFEEWRNSHLANTAKRCKSLESGEDNDDKLNDKSIVHLPKCLVHFTRKMCKCNHDCIGKSFKGSDIDTGCSSFETKNIWYDDNYVDCNFIEWTVNNGSLSIIKKTGEDQKLYNEIMVGLEDLCHSKKNFLELLCKSYDLRDNCHNNHDCVVAHLDKKPKYACLNDEYDEQREILEKVLSFNFQNVTDQLQSHINNKSAVITQLGSKDVVKRDLSHYEDLEFRNMQQDIYNNDLIELTDNFVNNTSKNAYSAISLSVISGVMLVVLAITGIKNAKKSFIIPVFSLITILFMISIYLSFNE